MTAIEVLEHYSSAHPETVDELCEWPWLRMETFYNEFVFRTTIERLERQKDAIIAALHGNPVFDENEEARRDEATQATEDAFAEMIEYLHALKRGELDDEFEDEVDPSNPFWAPVVEAEQRLSRSDEGAEHMTAGQLAEGQESVQEVRKLLASLDQTG